MHNVYLFQPQFSVGQGDDDVYWLPYSVGCIWAYAVQHQHIADNFRLADIVFRREHPVEILERMHDPSICGFSCYTWNINYNLHLAHLIRQRWPNCVLVFGGPQVNQRLLKLPCVDTVIMGEGEQSFLSVLGLVLERKTIPTVWNQQRIDRLALPSPYSADIFEPLLAQHPQAVWSATLETNRGCPFSCTFCDWGSLTYSKIKKFDTERVKQDIDWITTHPVSYLFCADANFGVFAERDLDLARYIVDARDQNGSILDTVSLQYAKNSNDTVFEIAKAMRDLHRGITVSLQSLNPDTLTAIKRRNLEVNKISEMMALSRTHNVSTYSEMILGLPLETKQSWCTGLTDLLEMGQHNNIDVWFCQLLENSELASAESRQRYGLGSVVAKDYFALGTAKDYNEVCETVELINQTNTMSTHDMVESYLYAWMIVQFHIGGYSNVYAQWARHVRGIAYKDFYDGVWQDLNSDPQLRDHINTIKHYTYTYLTQGKVSELEAGAFRGHSIYSMSYKFLYDHRTHINDQLQLSIAARWGDIPFEVSQCQSVNLYDHRKIYPITFGGDLDIESWQPAAVIYTVHSQLPSSLEPTDQFYRLRRQGKLKNRIIKHVIAGTHEHTTIKRT